MESAKLTNEVLSRIRDSLRADDTDALNEFLMDLLHAIGHLGDEMEVPQRAAFIAELLAVMSVFVGGVTGRSTVEVVAEAIANDHKCDAARREADPFAGWDKVEPGDGELSH